MFAPQAMVISVSFLIGFLPERARSIYAFAPATASAPAGSRMLRVSWNTSLIAAQTSSVSTTMTSSTCSLRQAEGFFADQLDRGAVRKQADVGQRHAPAGLRGCAPWRRNRWSARR